MAGSLKARGPGRWQLIAFVGKDDAGVKQYRWKTVQAGTKRQAQRLLAAFVADVQRGVEVKPKRDSLTDYLHEWLADIAQGDLAGKTVQGYTVNVERHILPVLGGVRLQKVRPADLQRLQRVLHDKGLSPRSVEYVHAVLRKALGDAWRVGLLAENPAAKVHGPRVVRKAVDVPPVDKIVGVLETLRGKPLHGIALLAVTTGLRRSEVLALQWRDVNLEAATLHVRHSLGDTKAGVPTFAPTKSPTSRRTVALPPGTVAHLRTVRAGQDDLRAMFGKDYRDNDLVFCHPDGSALLGDSVSHAWRSAVRRAGLPGFRFHDLRHAYSAIMLQANVNPKVLQAALGHSSISVTMDTYGHLLGGMSEKAALAVDAALKAR